MDRANFIRANLIGAIMTGPIAERCNFESADFYWAEIEGFTMADCATRNVRFPEALKKVANGPGAAVPQIRPLPLHRVAASDLDRKRLHEAVTGR